MIDITNRQNVFKLLENLYAETIPKFGTMTAQHMVEHLAFAVSYSNGNNPLPLMVDREKADRFKQFIISTDNEIQPGFISPLLKDKLSALRYSSMQQAIEGLKRELTDFDNHFKDKEKKEVQPVLGELNHHEWLIFHNKHFYHHFGQFNLLQANHFYRN